MVCGLRTPGGPRQFARGSASASQENLEKELLHRRNMLQFFTYMQKKSATLYLLVLVLKP